MTEIVPYDQEDPTLISRCVDILARGGVIVYPTDTVYGLGADATNPDAVARVRNIKGKQSDRPILAMVADIAMLEQYAEQTPLSRKLAAAFLPGPLSLILKAHTKALDPIVSEDGSLGFRISKHPFCLAVADAFHKPITSTSVNRSGMVQPRVVGDMLAQLGTAAQEIDLVVDAGDLMEHTPSTIVDARGKSVVVVREGAISRDRLLGFGA
jgi:L-threonylcarbamoyladenylate synthase